MSAATPFFKRAALGLMLALGGVELTSVALSTPAMAEPGDMADDRPDFGNLTYVPGRHWYRLATNKAEMSVRRSDQGVPPIPGLVVGAVQAKQGRPFCYFMRDGAYYTNLMSCTPRTLLMSERSEDVERGLVKAPAGDITNLYYSMNPTHADVRTAKAIAAELSRFRWPAPVKTVEEKRPVIEAAPVAKPKQKPKRVVTPAEPKTRLKFSF